jgi:hypothetical protein
MSSSLKSRSSRGLRGFLASLLSMLSLAACGQIVMGNGRVVSEQRDLAGFRSVDLSGSGTLKLHRGAFRVEVKSDSNVIPYIRTEVSGGELRIGQKPMLAIIKPTILEIDVTMPELEGVIVSGSGMAYAEPFSGHSFSGRVSGSGGFKGELAYDTIDLGGSGSGGFDLAAKASRLELRCSGSGGAFISGSADSAEIGLSGSAEIGARDFAVRSAKLSISGSGSVEIRAEAELSVTASGSGSVKYWGSPELSKHTSGSGKVSKAGD